MLLLPALGSAHETVIIIVNQPDFPYSYGRPQPPVALPEKGSLFSTGMIGNYSAVPYPARREEREETKGEEARDRERPVIRLEDQRRRVRRLDSWKR